MLISSLPETVPLIGCSHSSVNSPILVIELSDFRVQIGDPAPNPMFDKFLGSRLNVHIASSLRAFYSCVEYFGIGPFSGCMIQLVDNPFAASLSRYLQENAKLCSLFVTKRTKF